MFKISAVVALLCVVLGYPVAYLLASLPDRRANPLLILVLLPFWTSALVRTAAWAVLLQTNGVVNTAMQHIGLIDAPIQPIYNRLGVRSEERRVGKECVSTCRSRGSPDHSKKKKIKKKRD